MKHLKLKSSIPFLTSFTAKAWIHSSIIGLSLSIFGAQASLADENDDLLERLEGKATLEQQQARKSTTQTTAQATEQKPQAAKTGYIPALQSHWKESFPTRFDSAQLAGGLSETGAFIKAGATFTNASKDSFATLDVSVGSPVLRIAGRMEGIPIEIQQIKLNDSSSVRFMIRPIEASAMLTLPEGKANGRQHLTLSPEFLAQYAKRGQKWAAKAQLSAGPSLGAACDGDACGLIVGAKIGVDGEFRYQLDDKGQNALKSQLSLERTFSLMDSLNSGFTGCLQTSFSRKLSGNSEVEGGVYVKQITFDMIDGEGARNSDEGAAFEGGVFGKIQF